MKKAFTLSEALVTLAIIGVLAAILIPVVDNVKPDKDKITYKKAIYSLNSAVSNAMDSAVYSMAANSSAYWKDSQVKDDTFCQSIADSLNTSGKVNCSDSGYTKCSPSSSSCYESPNFRTTDGIRYWGLEGKFTGDERVIYVDRALGTNELNRIAKKRGGKGLDAAGLKIKVRYDGKITTGNDEETYKNRDFSYENELINSSLQVSENKYDEVH